MIGEPEKKILKRFFIHPSYNQPYESKSAEGQGICDHTTVPMLMKMAKITSSKGYIIATFPMVHTDKTNTKIPQY
jgi:hypothetical protein